MRLAGRSVEFRWECRVSPRCYHRIRLGRHVVTSSRQARGEVVRVVVRVVVRMGRASGRQRPGQRHAGQRPRQRPWWWEGPLAMEGCREAENHNAPGYECSSMWDGPPGGVLALWPQ